MQKTRFLDLDCIRLQNDALELLVTELLGPRLIRLSLKGGENLLAELPGATIDSQGAGVLNLWGGHRLWHAPEVRRRTYIPDDQPLTINEVENGIEAIQPVEIQTGIQKSMRVTLPDQGATVIIDHTLKNEGLWTVELAPWAITQLKPGGVAIIPQITGDVDPDGLLPNRRVVLWPYTDVTSPYIRWGNQYVLIKADMTEGKLKLGFANPAGWLAYHVDQTLFVKQAVYQPEADYFDFGSSSECYCCPEFIELETIGPRTKLVPGQSVSHREIWRLYAEPQFEATEDQVWQLAEKLGL
jgi:hypothetical protein